MRDLTNKQNDKSIITVNRKSLDNGNGFIFGVSGAGMSFSAKMEMGQVYVTTKDDMLKKKFVKNKIN